MIDLSTNYLGLKLKNPVIIGSSGLSNSVEGLIKLADNNAGAVVLKSIFEEQINLEANKAISQSLSDYPEAADYLSNYTKANSIANYLKLIGDAKKAVNIPVIASINCVSASNWVAFAKKIEDAGADAIELNAFILPSNEKFDSSDNEKIYFEILSTVKSQVKIPLSLKMGHYSSGLANLIQKISWTGDIKGLVLFNRFYSPDIDLDNMQIVPTNVFSTPEELSTPLRWIALLSHSVKCDLVASTGIHDGKAAIKQILAGAVAVQLVSAIYKKGAEYINTVLSEMEEWMTANKYTSLNDFRGHMNRKNVSNPAAFERIQFMKYFSGIE